MESPVLKLYRKLNSLPFGSHIFNLGVSIKAPFFRTIRPNVINLEPSLCKVQMKERWGIKNHIGTINAAAMCTVAELTGGLALDATIPSHLRWLPKGMTVSYLKKAKGIIESTCEFDSSIIQEGDIILPIVLRNVAGQKVFLADITMYISRKKT
jgi:acyl-coenzyme A thioesterase PaaI-like protein